ncbi:DUF5686 and carboxypeptidase-like regulatory domain-containing protein [Mucilaginibacter ginkgonis]|uniref:Carboxypeptidase-like regulatory domain-containing protein n=1 Tax=Mucilaginibacter ginkgonis TaxID=2682091 RepID=A0A7T7JGE1_9SPHI|nr:DUF5686 and carboxypeptidase-like regulatory domain-containing protein [Mucilaginibacter ginkgonis]QQL49136.1 carboxypeptidase-like regulatory domain-containing protein [Mucilaginibacter ginkgonis]
MFIILHHHFKLPRLKYQYRLANHRFLLKYKYCFIIFFVARIAVANAQVADTVRKDTISAKRDTAHVQTATTPQPGISTSVKGKVVDAKTGKPLSFISIKFDGTGYGTDSNDDGEFWLTASGSYTKVTFSTVGYQSVTRNIQPGKLNELSIKLSGKTTQLKEVVVKSGKKQPYRNKGNPAVELIQQVIDHKALNRAQSSDYLQFDQYERIGFSVYNFPPSLLKSGFLRPYSFMVDTLQKINGKPQTSIPIYLSEKLSEHFYRKQPEKTIEIVTAQKASNVLKFIDTAGLGVYLNRLYGNTIDIYENNIFIVANQFLSPIADHSPNYYKFFITDTINTDKGKLIQLSFTPRNKGDLLFEGTLYVTLNGRYAVEGCDLNVNHQININFMRSLNVHLDFEDYPDGRYYLKKSDVKADFGLFKNKGLSIFGDRVVNYTNYKLNAPRSPAFYEGKSEQVTANSVKLDTAFWNRNRTDSLNKQQSTAYAHISRLETMKSYKRLNWWASTITGGYANTGPFQIGQIGDIYFHSPVEGSRFQLGGRSTPKLDSTIYLEGYGAYGTRDKQFKFNAATYFSLNKTPFYRYPNDYFKVSYFYDIGRPGQSNSVTSGSTPLGSFQSSVSDYFQYTRIVRLDYVKDFLNHFSYQVSLKNQNQQAAGSLIYQLNDPAGTVINTLSTTEVGLHLRYAPHEQFIQGTQYRHTIYSKYPIINLQIDKGLSNVFHSNYNYVNVQLNIAKRFYYSQLGTADVTLLGGYLGGKVPFPLLNISPANQSLEYDPDAYNKMYYLEFVSDHYAGINYTENFNGFFLNKIPLIEHLKWREYLSFKALIGGVRKENDPAYSIGLYRFPTGGASGTGTYSLGSKPYLEGGVGIGNIFKLIRVDVIKRFNYLDHPGVTPYGLKLSFSPDL